MQSIRLLTLTALLVSAGIVHAIDFKSVGAAPAVLYDAPSAKGIKQFVAPRGMPVEVVLTYGEWTKVRDAAGDLSWIETKALSSKRNLLVTAVNAKVRASADDAAAIVFAVDKGVLLEWLEPGAAGWLKVRHRDGQSGHIRATEVWGE
jgi:SH3-like domain-containing protein